MLSPDDLLKLARAYAAAEQVALGTVGDRACGNNKVFRRIAEGRGANTRTLELLENFFRQHWPAGAAWPEGIADPPGRLTRRRRNKPIDTVTA